MVSKYLSSLVGVLKVKMKMKQHGRGARTAAAVLVALIASLAIAERYHRPAPQPAAAFAPTDFQPILVTHTHRRIKITMPTQADPADLVQPGLDAIAEEQRRQDMELEDMRLELARCRLDR